MWWVLTLETYSCVLIDYEMISCLQSGRCVCDFGYLGSSCRTVAGGFSHTLTDLFDSPWDLRKRAQWASVIGGSIGTPCSSSVGSLIVMNGVSALRQIMTVDLDTRFLSTFQFTFVLGGAGCDAARKGQDVYLSYSKNGGVTWSQIMIFGNETNHFIKLIKTCTTLLCLCRLLAVQEFANI